MFGTILNLSLNEPMKRTKNLETTGAKLKKVLLNDNFNNIKEIVEQVDN